MQQQQQQQAGKQVDTIRAVSRLFGNDNWDG